MTSALALTACGTTQSASPVTASAGVEGSIGGSSASAPSTTASSTKPRATTTSKVVEDDQKVVNPCSADALGAAPGRLESAEYQDKNEGYGYVFMLNTSAKSCLLQDYPKITMQFAGGQPMESHVVTDKQPGAAETVLAPHEWAGFAMSWRTGLDCQTPLLLLVTPPSNGDPISVGANSANSVDRDPLHACDDGTLHVSGWEKAKAPY